MTKGPRTMTFHASLVESAFSIFKRGIVEAFHKLSLKRLWAEYDKRKSAKAESLISPSDPQIFTEYSCERNRDGHLLTHREECLWSAGEASSVKQGRRGLTFRSQFPSAQAERRLATTDAHATSTQDYTLGFFGFGLGLRRRMRLTAKGIFFPLTSR
jgi:hypothetical protein